MFGNSIWFQGNENGTVSALDSVPFNSSFPVLHANNLGDLAYTDGGRLYLLKADQSSAQDFAAFSTTQRFRLNDQAHLVVFTTNSSQSFGQIYADPSSVTTVNAPSTPSSCSIVDFSAEDEILLLCSDGSHGGLTIDASSICSSSNGCTNIFFGSSKSSGKNNLGFVAEIGKFNSNDLIVGKHRFKNTATFRAVYWIPKQDLNWSKPQRLALKPYMKGPHGSYASEVSEDGAILGRFTKSSKNSSSKGIIFWRNPNAQPVDIIKFLKKSADSSIKFKATSQARLNDSGQVLVLGRQGSAQKPVAVILTPNA